MKSPISKGLALCVLAASSFVSASDALAFFGPKNYDDCILESMKGVTSNLAAAAIMKSCREKFPEQKREYASLPTDELRRVQISSSDHSNIGQGSFVSTGPDATGKFNVFNGSERWSIKEVQLAVDSVDGAPAPESLRRRVIAQSVDIGPQRNGDFIMYARELGVNAGQRTRVVLRVVGAKGLPAGR